MIVLSNEVLVELLAHHEPPCLSLCQPTHRRHPENTDSLTCCVSTGKASVSRWCLYTSGGMAP